MKSYLCLQCGEAILVGTPVGAIRRRAVEVVRKGSNLMSRILTGRRRRRARETQDTDAFLAAPFRYSFLPTACPHCNFRGPRGPRGRRPWWEPGLAYKD